MGTVKLLAEGNQIPEEYNPHSLKGNWKNYSTLADTLFEVLLALSDVSVVASLLDSSSNSQNPFDSFQSYAENNFFQPPDKLKTFPDSY